MNLTHRLKQPAGHSGPGLGSNLIEEKRRRYDVGPCDLVDFPHQVDNVEVAISGIHARGINESLPNFRNRVLRMIFTTNTLIAFALLNSGWVVYKFLF